MDANHPSSAKASLFVVSAASGAGKTSLLKAVLQKMRGVTMSTSHTTRPPREGEVDGKDYHFVSVDTFKSMIEQGDFFEYANVFENYYGTAKSSVDELLEAGQDVILEIDWQGGDKVRAVADPVSIFVLPPSLQELKKRLTGRGTDSEEVISRRLSQSLEDCQHYKNSDYVVINDDFDVAVDELIAIIRSARNRRVMIEQKHQALLNSFS